MASLYACVWECPHCSRRNVSLVEDPLSPTHLARCELENGGCDHLMAVVPELPVTAQAHPVEGL